MRPIQEPETTVDEPGERISRHPAFGQIVAHRVSGHRSLYGSDFTHNAFITISISRSEMRRSLSYDWHHATDEIIEVELSEAQWATFVSALNVGQGVPCTIRRVEKQLMPELPPPPSRIDQFEQELKEKVQHSFDQLDIAIRELNEMGLPKGKAGRIRHRLEHVRMQLRDNLPFIAKSFSEHMETTVEKAKAEVHGYMSQVLQRAGLDALTNGKLPLQIEQVSDEAGSSEDVEGGEGKDQPEAGGIAA
mgnify:CR=1 FL=1